MRLTNQLLASYRLYSDLISISYTQAEINSTMFFYSTVLNRPIQVKQSEKSETDKIEGFRSFVLPFLIESSCTRPAHYKLTRSNYVIKDHL